MSNVIRGLLIPDLKVTRRDLDRIYHDARQIGQPAIERRVSDAIDAVDAAISVAERELNRVPTQGGDDAP